MKRFALVLTLTPILIGLAVAPAVAQEPTQITCVSDDGSISEDIKFLKRGDIKFAFFVRRQLLDITPVITDNVLEFNFDEEIKGTTIRTSYWINRNSGRYTSQLSFPGEDVYSPSVHSGSCALSKKIF